MLFLWKKEHSRFLWMIASLPHYQTQACSQTKRSSWFSCLSLGRYEVTRFTIATGIFGFYS